MRKFENFCRMRPALGENIAAVMPLADRFGAKFILEKCKHFLVDEMPVTDAIPILSYNFV